MINAEEIKNAVEIVRRGGIIAYPTEAVFGFGCDPFNRNAVDRILQLKQRSRDKGLIIIAATWDQVEHLTAPIESSLLQKAFATWPGPATWVFPATELAPTIVTGSHTSIAIRITDHPIAKALCVEFGKPLVSTSANVEGQPPAKTYTEVQQLFQHNVDYIVPGEVGSLANPTPIRDILTDALLR